MKTLKLLLFLIVFSAPAYSFSQTLSWYKCLTGNIDKYAVTMHLHKAGNSYEGVYYYNSNQQPISFNGNDTAVAGKIQLVAYTAGSDDYETFTFSIEDKTANGEWKKNTKADALNFSATEVNDSSLISFTFVFTQGELKLRPALKESPVGSFSAASVWPSSNTGKANFIKQVIRQNFGNKTGSGEIGAVLLKQKKNFFVEYKKEYANEDEKEMTERPFSFNMDAIKSLNVLFNSNKLLSMAHAGYSYTGGAHGNHGTSYINLNLVTRKKLSLNDVVTKASKPGLNKLLAQYYRKDRHLAPGASLKEDGLFEDKIDATDNFYVTGKGIGFVYSPYEIGPYAMGEINIFIPFSELEQSVQPSFKKLIN